MAATPESRVKAKIKDVLAKYNVYYAMPVGSMYGNSGVPDFLCCVKGHFLAIEAKAGKGKGKTTALQDKNLHLIERAGGTTLVIREDTLDLLELKLKEWV